VRGAAALALILIAGPALAQEDGFTARMDRALAPAGETAPFLRCSGFFRAFRVFAGPETDLGQVALQRELDLAVLSTILRQRETDADQAEVMAEIAPLIEAVAALYTDRIVANDAETGAVMDDGLLATLEVCSDLRERGLNAMEPNGD
jgi:hypothetical protein